MTIVPKGPSHDLQFSLYMDKFSLQKTGRAVLTLLPQFGATEQVEPGSEASPAVLTGMLGVPGVCPALISFTL